MKLPPIHNGLADIIDHYNYFILDIWGVLHDGLKAYAGVPEAMDFLKAHNKQVLLLSNSPNRTARVLEKVITPIGIAQGTYQHILTSGEAAHTYLKTHHEGQRVYTFWDDEPATALDGTNTTRVYNIHEADFLYGSLLPHGANTIHYADILAIAHARKLPFICGNPDRVVGIGDELHLCVGTLAENYEKNGGHVIWIGKPHRPIYDLAWEMLGRPDKSKILAIGDSLVTDVAGAKTFGCDVLWNVTGIHWEELKSAHAETTIDPTKASMALKNHAQPTGLLHGFVI